MTLNTATVLIALLYMLIYCREESTKMKELNSLKKELHRLLDECNDCKILRLIFTYIVNIL